MKPEEALKKLKYLAVCYEEEIGQCSGLQDKEWRDYTEMCKIAIQALEKQIPKKPITDDNRILCPGCNLLIAYNKSIEQHCCTCGQNLEGCVIK